ncbi:Breast cancer 2, early onset [Mortierella sp. NVP85]|nr:Breast cancer 2, early onset [Mortierella sp. NVP85]
MTRTLSDGTRRSLQGLSPILSFDGLPETTGVVGWSSSMETPPKAKETYMYSQRGRAISEDILDQLRGNPRSTSTRDAKDRSELSQTTIRSLPGFSPVLDEDDDNEQGLESSRKNYTGSTSMRGVNMENATQMLEMNDKPKDGLETAGIGFTLPISMVQELEQDSPVFSRRELPSPIQSESPTDIFDSISSSAIRELERSTGSLTRNSQLRGLSGSSRRSQSRYTSAEGKWPMEATSRGVRSNTLEKERLSTSQDSDLENLQFEPWVMTSSTERERSVYTDNHQDVREEGDGYHAQYAMGATQDDDLEGIRFSQLDDTFAVDTEATPRRLSMDKTAALQAERAEHRIEDIQKHPIGSSMFGNGPIQGGVAVAGGPSSSSSGGFPRDNGRKLIPVSMGPYRVIRPSVKDNNFGNVGGMDASRHQSPPTSSLSKGLGGFQTAGNKAIAVSKAALERAAKLMQDDDDLLGMAPQYQDQAKASATTSGLYDPAASSATTAESTATQTFTGFKTGRGIPLAASKAARERAEELFAESDVETQTFTGFKTGRGIPLAASKAARERAEELLAESDVETQTFTGFKTGRGIPVATSKAARERAEDFFAEDDMETQTFSGFKTGKGIPITASKAARERADDFFAEDDMDDPRIPKTLGYVKAVPSIQPAQSKGSRFSSGKGNALTASTRFALADPDSMYTRSLESIKPGSSGKRLPSITLPEHQSFSIGVSSAAPQQPAISPHMINLRLKSLRAGTSGSSQPGLVKSKMPFKSPMKRPLASTAVGGTSNSESSTGNNTSAEDISPSKNSGLDKSHAGRRVLHPNARMTSTALAPPPSATHTPRYTSLFHLPGMLNSFEYVASGSYVSKVVVETLTKETSMIFTKVQGQRSSLRDTLGCPHPIEREELLDLGVPEAVIDMTLDDAWTYRFETWGLEDAYHELIARGAAPSLLSNVWLSNHYGLIVWKLACYLRSWPHYFLSRSLSWFCPAGVLNQLAYRYEREINLAERPALRKIVEGDEAAGRHMVLCIASVAKEYSGEAKGEVFKVTVTDGWYVLPAVLDPCLTRAVERGRLKIGSKVHVCRAKLSGAENGVAILELAGAGSTTTSVSIVLQANSTRLAAWDTKLGFQRSPMVWTTQIRSISAEGGLVPGLDVVILRKYPVIFMETLEDGVTRIKRTAREEDRAIEAHQEQISKRYQDMVQEVERIFGGGTSPTRIQDEIQARAGELEAQVSARNVVPFFTIRVGTYGNNAHEDRDENGRWHEALVTIWNSEHALYQEGHRFRITSLIAKRISREPGFEDMIQLTSTRMTTAQEMATDPAVMAHTNYQPRTITSCAEIECLHQGAEIDLAVIILAIGNRVAHSNRIFMVVTDDSQQLTLVEHQVSADQTLPVSLKVHARILMASVRYKTLDHKLGVRVVVSLQNYTHITVISSGSGNLRGVPGWPSYAQPSLQQLTKMVDGGRGQGRMEGSVIVELMARANEVLMKIQPVS